MRGIVGKLPRPTPMIVLPPESSESDAKVVAAVTGWRVNVLIAPEATRSLDVRKEIAERYVTTSLWKRLS
jgi:hypothetical protein